MPKHHSVTPTTTSQFHTFTCMSIQPHMPKCTHTHTHTLSTGDPGAFLIEAKWFVCFCSSNENRLSGIYTSSADLTTYTFPSCCRSSLAKTDMWRGPELWFQTETQHEHHLCSLWLMMAPWQHKYELLKLGNLEDEFVFRREWFENGLRELNSIV